MLRIYRAVPVSIHARVQRATYSAPYPASALDVSIHARVQRATSAAMLTFSPSPCFNSRSRTASDAAIDKIYATERVSIHARVQRATPDTPAAKESTISFNSRSRTASDTVLGLAARLQSAVSIHARVQRATPIVRSYWLR